jgi:protein-tyrosine phosphatase
MAEALFQERNLPNMDVRSAGIYAMDGGEISENAKQVISEKSIDFMHFSRQVNEEDLHWADLILTMTTAHKQLLVQAFPYAIEKTFTLKEYVRPYGSQDVSDPFGGDVPTYQKTFNELETLIEALSVKLMETEKW